MTVSRWRRFRPGQHDQPGLQIVRSLVQADLRGEISLENQAGRGVVATIVFPKASSTWAAHRSIAPADGGVP